MPTHEERLRLIEEIRELPDLLDRAVSGLNDEQLDTPYRDGGWTVRQVTHHIADSHLNGFVRMRLIVTEEHPTLKPYDQDLWADLPDSRLPVEPSLALVRGLHERWAFMLDALPADAWNRAAYHPENGEMTLDGLLVNYAEHGRHHVEQITGLRERSGWELVGRRA